MHRDKPPGIFDLSERSVRYAAGFCFLVDINHGHLDPALVKAVHNSGHGVLAYTVNDSQTAIDMLDWGVDALVTDQLDAITPAFT